MSPDIPVFEPCTGIHTVKAITDALDNGWLGMGTFTKEFEDRIGHYLGLSDRHVLATNTGTSALHLALLVAGVGPGDEVIVPSFNFVADMQAIVAVGASPVFCDISPDTLGIDPSRAEELVSTRTRAIMPLHYAGQPCDLDAVYSVARQHGLRVIEDATHAFGSIYNGTKIGSFGDIACFSFDPVKIITSIDGGAVVCRTAEELTRLRQYRFLGIDKETSERYKNQRAWEYDVVGAGFRYHMTNVNASVGLSQLERIDTFIETRRGTCDTYNQQLDGLDGITIPSADYARVSPFIYYIRVRPEWRVQLIAWLKARNIATGIHFMPAHRYSFFNECRRGPLPITEQVCSEQLTLPLHSNMPIAKVQRVVEGIRGFVKHASGLG